MTTETMNVHKALAELKTLDARINKKINSQSFVAANRASNKKIGGVDISEYKKTAVEEYQSIRDLIRRYFAIKRAVTLSNATTMVEVAGETMSVAEAIYYNSEYRNNCSPKQILLRELTSQYTGSQAECNRRQLTLEERAEDYAINLLGSKEKVDAETFETTKNNYRMANEYSLVDPIEIAKEIEKLSSEIDSFKADVDAAISVSNAKTEITINY
jgi:hypothetical protein